MNTKVYPKLNLPLSQWIFLGGLFGIASLMLVPFSAGVLDTLFILNFAGTLLILFLSVTVSDSLKIYSFPNLLLLVTLLRLSLSISSTRLILTEGHAGRIVEAIGELATQNQILVGLVVFLAVQIVQFLVLTKGSERVAEVAARFTLDALPGKQMSIDADLRAGLLSNADAQMRRQNLQRESRFFGAMDGAMKFIKGEAIASLILVMLNMAAGFCVGIFSLGLTFEESFRLFTRLSIGEALAAQIPAFLLAMAAGFIVTRVQGSDHESSLGQDLIHQTLQQPGVFLILASVLLVAGGISGMPFLPWSLAALASLGIGIVLIHSVKKQKASEFNVDRMVITPNDVEEQLGQPHPLVLQLSKDLMPRFTNESRWRLCFDEGFRKLRQRFLQETGVPLPEIKLQLNSNLPQKHYAIAIHGTIQDDGWLPMDHDILLSDAPQNSEVTDSQTRHGTPIRLVKAGEVCNQGFEDAPTYLLRHLAQTFLRCTDEFLGIQEVKKILSVVEQHHPDLVREVVPRLISLNRLTELLRRLCSEGVSLTQMRGILETLSNGQPDQKDLLTLCEDVRAGLSAWITQRFSNAPGSIQAYVICPELEDFLESRLKKVGDELFMQIDSQERDNLMQAFGRVANQKNQNNQILLTQKSVRRCLKKLLEQDFPKLVVLSFQEIKPTTRIDVIAEVTNTAILQKELA